MNQFVNFKYKFKLMIGVRLTQQLHLKNDATIRNEAK